ncbi:glycogen debranching enzyme GlgX [Nakamurella silvestris]|nr:glycogen debranching enzyme GlgX [Nakamurella silvestris]
MSTEPSVRTLARAGDPSPATTADLLPEVAAPTPFPGRPFPLGATVADDGTYFAVTAREAEAVELCLIDADGEERRLALPERTFRVWHGFVPGVRAGQRYGYRVHGQGPAVDPAKLLLDPYARRVDTVDYDLQVVSTAGMDSRGFAPLGVVTAPGAPPRPGPQVPWEHTVVYEAHVKGLTQLHPDVPVALRGTYLGVCHPAVIEHLKSLRVTSLELLPVHAHTTEPALKANRRQNYWGYSTLSFFAPHPRYASRPLEEIAEFTTMVDTLHANGIEVILDVVYNHTAEGGKDLAAPLSLRGLDRTAYYLADGHDITGTGNTLNTGTVPTVRMVCDSLRYWAGELGVDGFRFDLASVLGRPRGGAFDRDASLLTAIAADPLLCTRKLIAEPWDATGEGYAVGGFGAVWAEWNDRYRDGVRDFWRGNGDIRDLAYRLSGSSDLYGVTRRPWASVNFITAHDGFTLRDVVSYEHKHNQANGEDGRDGTDNNRSANYGVEGQTDDTEIRALRTRQARNLAATLLLSTGTPMISQGDELYRTQLGNNNAYCQDNRTSWVDWSSITTSRSASTSAEQVDTSESADMLAFFRHTLAVRADAPALHQGEFFEGRNNSSTDGLPDVVWFAGNGEPMSEADWYAGHPTLMMWIDGEDVRGHGTFGQVVTDYTWLLVLHGAAESAEITLPSAPYGQAYTPVIDTDAATGVPADAHPLSGGIEITIPGRTVWLLRVHR